MSAPARPGMTTAAEPDGAPRVAGLDILRGIAILAILFMNIADMGGSALADGRFAPLLGWTLPDRIAWASRAILVDGTARGILEMLFGAGMAILTDRAAIALGEAAWAPRGWLAAWAGASFGPWPLLRGYGWRNLILLAFGLIHLFLLLWPGDILHTYAIAALVAVLFRRLEPGVLLMLGLAMSLWTLIADGSGLYGFEQAIARDAMLTRRVAAGGSLSAADRDLRRQLAVVRADRARLRADTLARIRTEDRARSARGGTARSWVLSAWSSILFYWGVGGDDARFLEAQWIWEAAGTMLIGAALLRWGVIQGRRSRRFYGGMMIAGYAIGIGGRLWRIAAEMRFDDQPSLAYATYDVTRLAMVAGHLALVWLLLGTGRGARLLQPFAAAGRSALSLYIAQTLICLWVIFPPFALGLYGRFGWWQLMVLAAAIDAVLLVGVNWYMRRFTIAPVEWAWRSIVAGRRLPVRQPRAA